ncbi:MAG: HlyC/CorC family transporter, partial [Anaerolineales bacterium]|nr:HlyC/CorC family transporter [Anaerolineales bacterium]
SGPLTAVGAGLAIVIDPLLDVVNNAIGTEWSMVNLSPELFATILVLFMITTLQVVLGELLPKSIAIQFPERLALMLTIPMRISLVVLYPLIALFNGSGNLILRLIGQEHSEGHAHIHSPQEIEILVTESHEGGLLDADERQMLRNAFRLRDLTARQIMVHRTSLISAPLTMSVAELLQLSIATGKSRIPVYEDDIDNVKGFVHFKDAFRLHVAGRTELEEVVRPAIYVPEAMPAADVWEQLQQKRQYLCLVFDEFGGTAGLITQEDLIEEIFGEVLDEYDVEKALMYIGERGLRRLRGDLLVNDVNEYLGLNLPHDADSLSGLIISELGRPPVVGDMVQIGTTRLRVEALRDLGVGEISIDDPTLTGRQVEVSEWEVPNE